MDWIGVDPGGRWTGVAAVRMPDRELHHHAVITRSDGDTIELYVQAVTSALEPWVIGAARIAIEGIVTPTPHMGLTNVRGIIDTAIVFGAVLGAFPGRVVEIDPGGHGSGPKAAYPAALWGERERVGTGIHRHARSAFDVAVTAGRIVRR